ncbi:MAG: hypothetical protein HZC47_07750 [Methanobacterium sp.]|uniref:hypothetical protein n=1 Tax=Methanobacterium sp. TaxID=2164 RepID=UPI003D646173|nr:hypothetical protein [Methanobacterium sp.]
MKDEIPHLYFKLKKYEHKSKSKLDGKEHTTRRYMIPIKKVQIEGTVFEDIEDIVILAKEDFEMELDESKELISTAEKFKTYIESKNQEISSLNDLINEKDNEFEDFKHLNELKVKELQLDLEKISEEHKNIKLMLNSKIEGYENVEKQYKDLKLHNKKLEKEIKRLNDLRTLERESFKIKLNETVLTQDDYKELKRSHELLWDVVREKDKIINDLEKKGIVNNLMKKIRND